MGWMAGLVGDPMTPPDTWRVLRIAVPTDDPDSVEDWIAGVQVRVSAEGAYEAAGDQGPEWRLFFEPDAVPDDAADEVMSAATSAGFDRVRVLGWMDVARENWQDRWRDAFVPVAVGPGLEVRPSWYKGQPEPEGSDPAALTLFIEPGMAFGTGTHETTKLCLRALGRLMPARRGAAVLDAGSGSAILAIAAKRLGAGPVVAFDFDPVVEENARLNLELNDLPPDAIDVRIGGMEAAGIPAAGYGVVVCNMLSREFTPLLPDLAAHLTPDGVLILSGLLTVEQGEIETSALAAGLATAEPADHDGEWTLLTLRRA